MLGFRNDTLSSILNFIKAPLSTRSHYAAVPTTMQTYDLRVRQPSQDSDSTLSLHESQKALPVLKSPPSRKGPRDVERGSPFRSRSTSHYVRETGNDQREHSTSTHGRYRSTSQTRTINSMLRPQDDAKLCYVPAYSPSLYRPSPPLASPPFFQSYASTPRPQSSPLPHQKPHIDNDSGSDLSASELMDLLTDLEPVVSASASTSTSTRPPLPSPGLIGEEHHVIRKRSLSSDSR